MLIVGGGVVPAYRLRAGPGAARDLAEWELYATAAPKRRAGPVTSGFRRRMRVENKFANRHGSAVASLLRIVSNK